jgi:hypothetical protein
MQNWISFEFGGRGWLPNWYQISKIKFLPLIDKLEISKIKNFSEIYSELKLIKLFQLPKFSRWLKL